MKHYFHHLLWIGCILFCTNNLCFAQVTSMAATRFMRIQGTLYNKNNHLSVQETLLTLIDKERRIYRAYSNETGKFIFDSVIVMPSFTIQVQAEGYDNFFKTLTIKEDQSIFDAGVLYLTPKITILSTASYISDQLLKSDMLPTRGAEELFYTLNPGLRNQDSVASNYRVKLPDFPRRDRDVEKQKNKDFKNMKRESNPDARLMRPLRQPDWLPEQYSPLHTGSASGYNISNQLMYYFKDHPEKFVFVIWKKDENGNAILKGSEVESRFLVYYYPSFMEGDTSAYHKADNATYGYAPLWNATYKIRILDKMLHKMVDISDPIIETRVYFEKRDLLRDLNMHINWIKIPIEIFE